MQLARQLVEQDHVFAMFNTLGTPSNTAIRPYLNQNQVPQLYVATGATTWAHDSSQYPWTIGWQPDYQSEAIIYARNLLKVAPNAKIGVIYQNDDYGKDYLAGLHKGLGPKSSLIVKEVSYETTDPDVSSQIGQLKASGADTFFIFATPKFALQSLVIAAQQSWHPTIYLNNVSANDVVMKGATEKGGATATAGVISVGGPREVAAAARLDHPNIVRIFDVARYNDAPYLVMEHVVGSPVTEWADARGLDVPDTEDQLDFILSLER